MPNVITHPNGLSGTKNPEVTTLAPLFQDQDPYVWALAKDTDEWNPYAFVANAPRHHLEQIANPVGVVQYGFLDPQEPLEQWPSGPINPIGREVTTDAREDSDPDELTSGQTAEPFDALTFTASDSVSSRLASNTEIVTSHGELTDSYFGGVLINNYDYDSFMEDYSNLGLSIIRFPGGTAAEKGLLNDLTLNFASSEEELAEAMSDRTQFYIDLTFPELINPGLLEWDDSNPDENSIASLSELFQSAIENDAVASIILPVRRYFANVDLTDDEALANAMEVAKGDLELFLRRLLDGEFNNGEYPRNLILEIGNENYSYPVEYAVFSKMFIDVIEDNLEGSGISYDIAFQMNIGSQKFSDLSEQGYFETYFGADGQPLVDWLDGVTFDPLSDLTYQERIYALDEIMAVILGDSILDVDMLRQHFLGLDADNILNDDALIHQRFDIFEFWLSRIEDLGGSKDDVELYVSAWTVDSSDVGNFPAGMAAAGNVLLATQLFMENGVDLAAAWGFNGSESYWPENSPTTALSFTDDDVYTPAAEVIGLLSQYAVGHELLDYSVLNSDSGDGATYFREHLFWSEASLVAFFTVGDIQSGNTTLKIDLGAVGEYSLGIGVRVATVDGEVYGEAASSEFDAVIEDGVLEIEFQQDYQVIMLSLENSASYGTAGDDTFQGTSKADAFFATDGDDVASGWGGDDRLFGDAGDDLLYGNDGDDFLAGGYGDDVLRGGTGIDTLYGDEGNDTLDGQEGNDVLYGGSGSDHIVGGAGNDALHAVGETAASVSGGLPDAPTTSETTGDWRSSVLDMFDVNRLDGGSGNDDYFGSKGVDEFIFSSGADVIHGFQSGVDRILLSQAHHDLISGSAGTERATNTSDGLLFDFGTDGSLLLSDVHSLDVIVDDVFVL